MTGHGQVCIQAGSMMSKSVANTSICSEANTKDLNSAMDGKVAAQEESYHVEMGNALVAFEDKLEKKAARTLGDADL